jgi:hypothetical protein
MVSGPYIPPIEPDPIEIAARLAATAPRGACSDGERRAAVALRDELRLAGRPARLETAWVRPGWPIAYALLCLLGAAGSLAAISWPAVGLGVIVVALVLLAGDLSGRLALVRLLLPRRATVNLVSEPPPRPPGLPPPRVRLIVTAALDAGRAGLVYRLAPLERRLRRMLRGHLLSPAALLCLCLAIDAGAAAARLLDDGAGWPSIVALVPTIVLLAGAAACIDIALAGVTPGANTHASAAAVAFALTAALDRDPPRHLAVELVLTGAGEGGQLGMRAYVARRRRGARPEELAVLAFGPCGAGTPRVHVTEGLLWPQRLHPTLVALAGGPPLRRGTTNAAVARRTGWPAVAISALDERERPGRSHKAGDAAPGLERASIAGTLERSIGLVRALDGQL